MFPTDSIFRPAPKPTIAAPKPPAITTGPNAVAKPLSQVAAQPLNLVSVTHFSDGMMSDRLSQVKANAYRLGGTSGPVMSWVDPPGTGPVWPKGPLSPDGGATKQPGVDVMQDKLIDLGYLDGAVITDDTHGRYGPKTEAAVKDFQFANGLPVTGVADEATLALMGGPQAITRDQALSGTMPVIGQAIGTAGPSPVPTMDTLQIPPRTGTVQANGYANIRGDPSTTNKAVGSVANGEQLTIVGQNEQGNWLHVTGKGRDGKKIDGWISSSLVNEPPRQDPRVASRMEDLGYIREDGQVNEMAVKNFQTMNGLPETGTLDDDTLAAMWSADAKVNAHVTQLHNATWNPEASGSNNNCGPASVAMALASAGLIQIDPAHPEAAIDAARNLAGGTSANTTGSGDLKDAVTGQGGEAYTIASMDQMQIAVSKGDPVVLFGYEQKNTSYRGAHWVAVVGYDQATGSFLVQDPLATNGVQHWSRADMEAYANFTVDTSVAVHNPNG